MYRTIFVILLSGIHAATCVAQEQLPATSAKSPTDAETATPNSNAIVLVIDANSQQSVAVKQVVEALEKAGIATTKSAVTVAASNSPISVTLNMQKDESYEKIKQLIEALKNAGVQRIAIREGGVQYQGKEINQLYVDLQPGYSPAEYEKIDLAAIAVMDQCGLSLLRARNWLPEEADGRRTLNGANLPVSDSSERTDPAMDSGFIHKSSQTADLRTQYEAANKLAHDLAESLRQTPDAAKKSELRVAVQQAFSQRQPEVAPADWLCDLQGTWTVTDSPIKVDENSGGQMKEIRIDHDQWSIVWTASPGDPDRVETLRVVRPDEKNLYAIDLVEPSTGKVVYPSLYEINQAGLTFCYGHLGERPKEIGNIVTIKLARSRSPVTP